MNNKPVIQKIVLAGVVLDNNKILIIKRNKNEKTYPKIWELPSGKREVLESSEAALKREIKEETSLDIEIIKLISVFDYVIEKENEFIDSTQINFLVKAINNHVVLSEEHEEFAWINKNDISDYEITDKTKNVINEAFKFLNI